MAISQQDIPLFSHFFSNREGNILIKEFEGILVNNPQIKNLDVVVGFLRGSVYFSFSISKYAYLIY